MQHNHDAKYKAKPLAQLTPSQTVYLPERKESGVITEERHEPSYQVQTPSGKYTQNHVHLNRLTESHADAHGTSDLPKPTTVHLERQIFPH